MQNFCAECTERLRTRYYGIDQICRTWRRKIKKNPKKEPKTKQKHGLFLTTWFLTKCPLERKNGRALGIVDREMANCRYAVSQIVSITQTSLLKLVDLLWATGRSSVAIGKLGDNTFFVGQLFMPAKMSCANLNVCTPVTVVAWYAREWEKVRVRVRARVRIRVTSSPNPDPNPNRQVYLQATTF